MYTGALTRAGVRKSSVTTDYCMWELAKSLTCFPETDNKTWVLYIPKDISVMVLQLLLPVTVVFHYEVE